MDFQRFSHQGGFKILALSKFSSHAFSLVCYLINCSLAGVSDVLCSSKELALMLDSPELKIKDALEELKKVGAISLKNIGKNNQTIRLSLEIEEWALKAKNSPKEKKIKKGTIGVAKNLSRLSPQEIPKRGVKLKSVDERTSATELLMFPIQKKISTEKNIPKQKNIPVQKNSHVEKLNSKKTSSKAQEISSSKAQRILTLFQQQKKANEKIKLNLEKEANYAELLAESHPENQIVNLIQKFGADIPSLGMLAGAWLHYVDRYSEIKKQEVSLDTFRKKIEVQEKKLRQLAVSELKKIEQGKMVLSSDEQLLLRIFSRHAEPRKQLYWALQAKERYPKLNTFFEQTKEFAAIPKKVLKKT